MYEMTVDVVLNPGETPEEAAEEMAGVLEGMTGEVLETGGAYPLIRFRCADRAALMAAMTTFGYDDAEGQVRPVA